MNPVERGDGAVAFVVFAFAALAATQIGRVVSTDGWLSLVAGRLISRHGLPSRNSLTVLGYGRRWVDQQWLAQVLLYRLDRVGGLPLVVAVHTVLAVGAFAAAVAAARLLGARPSSVAIVGAVSVLPFFATASVVRSQSFVYVLFVALVLALLPDRDLGTARIAVLLVLLVVWANLHGSVLLAAGIVSLRGAVDLRQRGRGAGPLVLLFAPLLCLLASPYATGLPHYYASTAFNPAFDRYLAQWGPTGLSAVSAPVFALVLGIVWLLGRTPATYTGFERGLLAVGVLVGLLAVRNWPWLVLISLVLVPRGIDAARRRRCAARQPAGRADAFAALVGVLLLVLGAAAGLKDYGRLQQEAYPAAAAGRAAGAAAAHPHGRIFVSVHLADWLLWREPGLAGRVHADARYELLTANELEETVLFRYGALAGETAAQNEIFLLDPTTDERAITAIRGRVRQVFRSKRTYVGVAGP